MATITGKGVRMDSLSALRERGSVKSPRIFLAIDNCFASKRWTRPKEWIELIAGLGVRCIEASADTECDPLYTTGDYLDDWTAEAVDACASSGARIANLYSGHGTYATLGLAHTDRRVRDHIQNNWLKPMARRAAALGAGLGFFCHAFPDVTLQEPERYRIAEDDLMARLAEVAAYCEEVGAQPLSVEQMYSPHQIPWTIPGAESLMRSVYERRGSPLYLTIDTGHQTGQRRYLRPTTGDLQAAMRRAREGESSPGLWLGSRRAHELFAAAVNGTSGRARDGVAEEGVIADILAEADLHPFLFAGSDDGDPYRWLERLGCYAPIVHLQQTDGSSSSHRPFTEAHNRRGIVSPERVLRSLAQSYARESARGMPPRCEEIYLTLEIFAGTGETVYEIERGMRESVEYWRRYIPSDGVILSSIL